MPALEPWQTVEPGMDYCAELQRHDGALVYPPCYTSDFKELRAWIAGIVVFLGLPSLEWGTVGDFERVAYIAPDKRERKNPLFLRIRRVCAINARYFSLLTAMAADPPEPLPDPNKPLADRADCGNEDQHIRRASPHLDLWTKETHDATIKDNSE